ncbi:enoyl-CoA hydratase/isomerase family protein [Porphyrobacter sp. GA68]|uniref:enoyl-CoA hydratase/isomerase family protein n=1 Tax=Porphyrobacter sp. GA68 TaxID=2883480 RepID=UPI001D194E1F|nr:enoyl-CoA hydratase/isomerase family protein [Porphyrobacter sp. GA68]
MTLRLEIAGHRATLLIDRAARRNAFTMQMWQDLPDLVHRAADDPQVRALVIRAAEPGCAFSAGADIGELLANKDDDAWREANQTAINRAQYELARLSVPVVALVEGDCIGGGCGIALACDLRVATPAARFGITPARLGLVYPLHDVKLLVDLVGPGQAKRMLYTGALLSAEEAERIGLVEELADDAEALVQGIIAASTHSVRWAKRFVRRVLDGQTEDDAETLAVFAQAFTGPDFAEGTAAFISKRPTEFR